MGRPKLSLEDKRIREAVVKQQAEESRLRGVRDLGNDIYTFIYETFKRERVPVDKFGHFYSKGGKTVEGMVSPDFSDNDFSIALLLDIKKKLEGPIRQ